jgi:hypothetical protein
MKVLISQQVPDEIYNPIFKALHTENGYLRCIYEVLQAAADLPDKMDDEKKRNILIECLKYLNLVYLSLEQDDFNNEKFAILN